MYTRESNVWIRILISLLILAGLLWLVYAGRPTPYASQETVSRPESRSEMDGDLAPLIWKSGPGLAVTPLRLDT
jgi:hypothetical protein